MKETTASERKWTRAHDALIARVAEGKDVIEVEWIGGRKDYGFKSSSFPGPFRHPSQAYSHVDMYENRLESIARAGDAWRVKDEEIDRTITINSAIARLEEPFTAEFRENYEDGQNYEWRTFKGDGDTESEARAWALYFACGGGK